MLEWFSMQLSKMITQKNPEESKKVGKKQRKPSSIIPKEWPKYAKDKNKAPEECCKKNLKKRIFFNGSKEFQINHRKKNR